MSKICCDPIFPCTFVHIIVFVANDIIQRHRHSKWKQLNHITILTLIPLIFWNTYVMTSSWQCFVDSIHIPEKNDMPINFASFFFVVLICYLKHSACSSFISTYFNISVRPLMKYVFTYSVPTFTFTIYDLTSCVLAKFIVTLCIFNVGKICEKRKVEVLRKYGKQKEKFWLRKVFFSVFCLTYGSKSLDCWNISLRMPYMICCWSSWPFLGDKKNINLI